MKRPSKRAEHAEPQEPQEAVEERQLTPGKLSLSQLQVSQPGTAAKRPGMGAAAPLGPISRKASGREVADDAKEQLDRAAARAGRPLPAALRAELEQALGADLSNVRIHTDGDAARAADAVGARAFARGDDIHFAAGEYDPSSAAGRELIAHEVAHTVQAAGGSGANQVSRASDPHERAADQFAEAFSRLGAATAQPTLPAAPADTVHRQEPTEGQGEQAEEPSHEDQLREIQAMQMSSLLPAIAALPAEVKTDYEAAHVGGPRLKAAMYAVNDGGDWKTYITSHNDVAGHLPADQLDAIMEYLGGPSGDFRFYQNVGNFDGSVEPGGYITLYWRVNFHVAEGTNLSGLALEQPDGRPTGWWDRTLELRDQFGVDFKRVVEQAWSDKASIKCESTKVTPFKTKVEISVVDTGYHAQITLVPGTRSSMHGLNAKTGTWSIGDNVERPTQDGHRQITSVHEFGHAIGVPHPDTEEELIQRYKNAKTPEERKAAEEALYRWHDIKDKDSAEYGDSHEEHGHTMGRGNKLTALQGPDAFDPFTPFQNIAKKWGDEFVIAPNLNQWSTA